MRLPNRHSVSEGRHQRAPERLLEGHQALHVAEIDDDPEAGRRIGQPPALIGDRIEMLGQDRDRIDSSVVG